MLRLLHLSDIHFRGYQPPWDDDEDQRRELVLDVKRLVDEGGTVAGIVIGGDIAFSGKPAEYAKAEQWLERLVEVAGCPPAAVWMVPGNHDVDREIVASSGIISDFYKAMRTCEIEQITAALQSKLYRDPASATLVNHLRGYNEFAKVRGCAVQATSPHWEDRMELNGHPLLLWGMNSVLCSDETDCGEPLGEATQFLGHQQAKIPRDGGEVRIAICHHPPGWLRDWTLVKDYVARAHVVLFGHMHTLAVNQDLENGPVHVHAGAVGPDQGDEWLPTYNLLSLSLNDERLRVEIRPRVWDKLHTCFVAAAQGIDERFVDLRQETPTAEAEREPEPLDQEQEVAPALATPLLHSPGEGGEMTRSTELRALVFNYLSLSVNRRLEIAEHLGVLDDLDVSQGDPFQEILARVRDRELIEQLAEELKQ